MTRTLKPPPKKVISCLNVLKDFKDIKVLTIAPKALKNFINNTNQYQIKI